MKLFWRFLSDYGYNHTFQNWLSRFSPISRKSNFGQNSLSVFSKTFANFAYFVSRPYDEKLAQRHLLKEYGILKTWELWKTWRFKFSSKMSFDKITVFESHEARKAKNSKLYWFCKPFASWNSKTSSDKGNGFWKLWSLKNLQKTKFSPFLRCKFQLFWQKMKLLKVLKLEKLF